ncbi:MAG: transposase [Candidatus Marinimicrobia bacterium]|nr:transposase [Candidatus Neomarinimicrobiota bacterium]
MYQESGIYHVFNRGWNHKQIFYSEENYRYLTEKIATTKERFGIDVIAYCLMPNHYHLLVQQNSEIPVSKWLQYIFNGYSQAINKQEGRKGTLFEGRPKHILIEGDKYFQELIAYIHFNPVAAGLVSEAAEWEFSNCQEWLGKRDSTLISKHIVDSFISKTEYKEFLKYYSEIQHEKILDKFKLEGS